VYVSNRFEFFFYGNPDRATRGCLDAALLGDQRAEGSELPSSWVRVQRHDDYFALRVTATRDSVLANGAVLHVGSQLVRRLTLGAVAREL